MPASPNLQILDGSGAACLIGSPAGGFTRGRIVRVDVLKHIPIQAVHLGPDVDSKWATGAILHRVQNHSAVHGLHSEAQRRSCIPRTTHAGVSKIKLV